MGLIFICLYVACEIIANAVAGKPVKVFSLMVPSAVFIYTFTFTLIDVLNEIYGRDGARKVVIGAFMANLLFAFYSFLILRLPSPSFFEEERSFEVVFGQTPRIVFASLSAYFLSSLIDIEIYHIWKRYVRGSRWSRVLVSNTISTFVDSVLFIGIAFSGIMPLSPLIIGQYIVKMAITLFSLPLIYTVRPLIAKAQVSP